MDHLFSLQFKLERTIWWANHKDLCMTQTDQIKVQLYRTSAVNLLKLLQNDILNEMIHIIPEFYTVVYCSCVCGFVT